ALPPAGRRRRTAAGERGARAARLAVARPAVDSAARAAEAGRVERARARRPRRLRLVGAPANGAGPRARARRAARGFGVVRAHRLPAAGVRPGPRLELSPLPRGVG